jgi:hypothetical protein
MANKRLKKRKEKKTNHQVPAGLIREEVNNSEMPKLIDSIENKDELPEQWKKLIIVPA